MNSGSRRALWSALLIGLTGCGTIGGEASTLDAHQPKFARVVRHDRREYDGAPRMQLRPARAACLPESPECHFDGDVVGTIGPRSDVLLASPGQPVAEFDSLGLFVRHVGTVGSGDGQYMSADHIAYDGRGTYSVLDMASLRVLSFDTAGRPLGARRVGARLNISGVSAWPGGIVLFMLPPGDSLGAPVPATFAVQTERDQRPRDVITVSAPANAVAGREMQPMRPYFLPMAVWALSAAGRLHYASGGDATVARYRADDGGAGDLLLDAGIPARAVTRAEVEAEKKRVLAMFDDDARIVPYVEQAAKHSARVHPPVTLVAALRDGSIWLREYAVAGEDSVRWNAFSADGQWLGWTKLGATEGIVDGDERSLIVAPRALLGASAPGPARPYRLAR